MKAIILCRDHEKGLMPINERTPASMIRTGGLTCAAMAVRAAYEAGASEIYAVCDLLSERIEAYFENTDFGGAKPRLIRGEQGIMQMTCGISEGEPVMLVDACGMHLRSLEGMAKKFLNGDSKLVLSAAAPKDVIKGCKIRTDGEDVLSFDCEPYSANEDYDCIFAGALILSSDLAERYKDRDFRELSEIILQSISDDEHISAAISEEGWSSLHSPEAFISAVHYQLSAHLFSPTAKEIADGIYSEQEISLAGVALIPPVYIGRGVTLSKGCVIENCTVEDNAVIGSRADLRGCMVGEAANVGAGVQAVNSVICSSANVNSSAQLEEYSVAGENSVIASGCQLRRKTFVYADKKTEAGSVIDDSVICGCGHSAQLDDDCACGFSSGVSTPFECTRFAMAIGSSLKEGSSVVCGCTGGKGAHALMAAFESGLTAAGINVLSVGDATAQEVMFLVNRLGANLGCAINAEFSERIQLMSRGGLPVSGKMQAAIERSAALGRYRHMPFDNYGVRYELSDVKVLYHVFLSQLMPAVFHGVNADIRCSSKELAEIADRLIRKRNDINGERIIFHISNDGKTCTAYTDDSGYVINEKLVLLAVKAAFEKNIPVALPFTFPMAADKIAEQTGGKLYRYFHAPMDDTDSAARQVARRPDNFFVRDGMVLMCMISAYLSEKRMTLSQALKDIPSFYSAQRFAAVKGKASDIYKALGCRRDGCSDGVVVQSETTRAMVRPLRHKQGLIIFAESLKAETASELCDDIIDKLNKTCNKNFGE